MANWIMKIDAKKEFRLADCLKEAFIHDGIIALANHQCTPQFGDTVYLVQTGKDRGLCGVATVRANSSIREQPLWQRQYGITNYEPHRKRVLLRIEMAASKPASIWRPNAGTMQSCNPALAEQFDIAAESFLTAQVASDTLVGLGDYLASLDDCDVPGATDRETRILARVEQAYWRRELFGDRQLCSCALCGQLVPRRLIVVAHVKRRSQCSREERLDSNNVIPACLLGCDALFENRYLTVEHGKIVGHSDHMRSPIVGAAIRRVDGKRLSGIEWTLARTAYFDAHAAYTE